MSLTYDSAYLRFDSGDGVTAGRGRGADIQRIPEAPRKLTFTMTFQALQEGTTEIGIASAMPSLLAGGTPH